MAAGQEGSHPDGAAAHAEAAGQLHPPSAAASAPPRQGNQHLQEASWAGQGLMKEARGAVLANVI